MAPVHALCLADFIESKAEQYHIRILRQIHRRLFQHLVDLPGTQISRYTANHIHRIVFNQTADALRLPLRIHYRGAGSLIPGRDGEISNQSHVAVFF